MNTRKIVLALLLSFATSIAASGDATVKPKLLNAEVKEIRSTVERIRAEILSENTQALLQEISQSEGLECTDTLHTYAEVRAYLKDHGSVFYKSLFDSSKFRAECGGGYPMPYPAISEKEFYLKASHDVLIESLGKDWVKVTIRSPIQSHYERELYLHKEGKVWKVGGSSFVIGECTCG